MIQPLKECHQFSTVSSSVSDFCPPFQTFCQSIQGPSKNTLEKNETKWFESGLDTIYPADAIYPYRCNAYLYVHKDAIHIINMDAIYLVDEKWRNKLFESGLDTTVTHL